jgi:hypothetical protein
MGERVLRGRRLGTTSYESDRGTDLAPRRTARYNCPHGHHFGVPLALDAEAPATWECRSCGAPALLQDGEAPQAKAGRPVRSHWDMLLERRSLDELEGVLAERLEELHASRKAPRKSA